MRHTPTIQIVHVSDSRDIQKTALLLSIIGPDWGNAESMAAGDDALSAARTGRERCRESVAGHGFCRIASFRSAFRDSTNRSLPIALPMTIISALLSRSVWESRASIRT